jgi:hypothetical protein
MSGGGCSAWKAGRKVGDDRMVLRKVRQAKAARTRVGSEGRRRKISRRRSSPMVSMVVGAGGGDSGGGGGSGWQAMTGVRSDHNGFSSDSIPFSR